MDLISTALSIAGLVFYILSLFIKDDREKVRNCLLKAIYWELCACVVYLVQM